MTCIFPEEKERFMHIDCFALLFSYRKSKIADRFAYEVAECNLFTYFHQL